MTIIDEIAYSGLTPGKTYTISGVLMDKATGEPLLVGGEKSLRKQSLLLKLNLGL